MSISLKFLKRHSLVIRYNLIYTETISVNKTVGISSPQSNIQVLTREPNQLDRLIGSLGV